MHVYDNGNAVVEYIRSSRYLNGMNDKIDSYKCWFQVISQNTILFIMFRHFVVKNKKTVLHPIEDYLFETWDSI